MSGNGKSLAFGVLTGRIITGWRGTFYGAEAVGKSTLGAYSPAPIFIDVEDGTSNLDVARYIFRDGADGHVPRTLSEIYAAIAALLEKEHPFKTVVIDTLDRLESLIWAHILERDSGKQSAMNKAGKKLQSIESYGYGKGYVLALDEWRRLCRQLDQLRLKRGMNVMLLGHAQIRLFKNPEGEDYDRYHLRVNDKAAGFIKEWCDIVGFCCYEEGGAKLSDDDRRAKGYSTGRRLIRLERTAAYDAKTRFPLPDVIELAADNPFAPLGEALQSAPDNIRASIATELLRLGDPALKKKVSAAVKKAGADAATLSRYLNDLKTRNPKEQEANV